MINEAKALEMAAIEAFISEGLLAQI